MLVVADMAPLKTEEDRDYKDYRGEGFLVKKIIMDFTWTRISRHTTPPLLRLTSDK